jgi:hypothetical protein
MLGISRRGCARGRYPLSFCCLGATVCLPGVRPGPGRPGDPLPRLVGGVILTRIVVTEEAFTALLMRLEGIAKAPMTGPERQLRAKFLVEAGLSPSDVARATARGDLPWNEAKASEYEVDVETWLQAVYVVDLPASTSLSDLLDRLHRTEAAVTLLKAGYSSGRNQVGLLVWQAPSR